VLNDVGVSNVVVDRDVVPYQLPRAIVIGIARMIDKMSVIPLTSMTGKVQRMVCPKRRRSS
jgi:hypothetical protein